MADMVSICCGMTREFAGPPQFAAHVVGQLNLEIRAHGWPGAKIFDAEWQDDALLVVAEPAGKGEISADLVSAFLREKRRSTKSHEAAA
jgi:hypothetical protein